MIERTIKNWPKSIFDGDTKQLRLSGKRVECVGRPLREQLQMAAKASNALMPQLTSITFYGKSLMWGEFKTLNLPGFGF